MVKKKKNENVELVIDNEETIELVDDNKNESEEKKSKNKLLTFIKGLIPYVVILVIVVLVRTYIVTPVIVSGESMMPTLDGGEMMILNKLSDYNRFDVVVVHINNDEIIKRIIAMPGESISCENGIVYVNGKRQDEEYSQGITSDFKKITLEDDEYFVMGDNRINSLDSRRLGPIKEEQIKGTTKLVLFPFNKIGNID